MVRPSDLKSPFKQLSKTALCERILYVPTRISEPDSYVFPGWNNEDVFNNGHPIKIEYCSGNGAWITEKAKLEPFCNWVAVEKKWMRVKKIWSKMKNMQLSLLIVCGEGYKTTRQYFPSNSVDEIYINFPDPWPKKRHFKNRLIQQPFLQEMERILKKGGKWIFVTDDVEYSEWMLKETKEHAAFASVFPDPYFVSEWPDYGNSYFEDLWREKGRIIRYHQFIKV